MKKINVTVIRSLNKKLVTKTKTTSKKDTSKNKSKIVELKLYSSSVI